jgi:hypothetical protein
MEAIYTCCAGLDVHKQTVECAVRQAQTEACKCRFGSLER